ncbi:hypothetical protein L3Y34_011730 [Caenorhabditis briggsae]|uniref:Uncharacterized protein n=1 Tax=Caenorhabditis briggsae TaxID=6238 RepID=A0AAE8ZMA9_CAEBR|nr:hypothetical protein L3Y34_011730 [Caenorhabditis briggsae]
MSFYENRFIRHSSFKLASWLLSRLLYKSLDSEESGGGGPPPDSLEIPDLVRYGDHQDPRDHHDPANLDKLGSNFLHHPAVMGSLEKLIRAPSNKEPPIDEEERVILHPVCTAHHTAFACLFSFRTTYCQFIII